MNAITLPRDLEIWAEAEVAAGRAPSVEALTVGALEAYRRKWAELRKSLDEASAQAARGETFTIEEAFDDLIEHYDSLS